MEKSVAEDELVGWHLQLSGRDFEQTPGDSERQGSLACCRVRHDLATEQQCLNMSQVTFWAFLPSNIICCLFKVTL